MADELMTSPERRSHSGAVVLGVHKHALKLVEVVFDVGAAFGKVDQQVLGSGEERLFEVADNEHSRVVVLTAIARNAEVVQRAVDGHESKPGAAIGVRYPVQALQNASCRSRQETARHARVAHIEQEEVDQRLRSANHVLLGSNEFADRVVQLRALPPVHGLLLCAVPIEALRHIVRQVAHVAAPPMRVVQETCEGVDVCPAAPATRNNLVVLNGHIILGIVKRGVRLNDERKRKLALFEEGVGRGHGIER
jgi:hypothetical protein